MPRKYEGDVHSRTCGVEGGVSGQTGSSGARQTGNASVALPLEGATRAPPHVAILGRPNVGKSTLFNRLVGRRRALVDSTSGVTRDRIYGACDWRGHPFRLIDTGGIDSHGQTRGNLHSEHRARQRAGPPSAEAYHEGGTQQALPASSEKNRESAMCLPGSTGPCLPHRTEGSATTEAGDPQRGSPRKYPQPKAEGTRAPVINLAANSLSQVIREQSLQAVAEADLILCVFDAGDGLTGLDEEIVTIARRSGCPVVYAINKVDTEQKLREVDQFSALGTDAVFPISAEHGRRIDDLLDAIIMLLRKKNVTCDMWDGTAGLVRPTCHMSHVTPSSVAVSSHMSRVTALHLAIIGRPNVGKSSLVNRLAGARRVVAHELPGTTRDVVDVAITIGNQQMVLLDTAGIRRKARTDHRVEKYAILKSLEAMERADVVVLLIDASEGITHQDRQLASRVAEAYRPFLVVANKWDLVPRRKAATVLEGLRGGLKELRRAPLLTLSARTGLRCADLLQRAQAQVGATHRRIKTARLNALLQEVQAQHHLPSYRSQPVRLYYATQVGDNPPSFTIFANYPASVPISYRRYLLKALEDALGAPGLPIRLLFRKRR